MVKLSKAKLGAWLDAARQRRWRLLVAALSIIVVLTLVWFIHLATAPARRAGSAVDLARYGVQGTQVKIVHPVRLSADGSAGQSFITILAQATDQEALGAFDMVFPLAEDAVLFVDAAGNPIPGRLRILPGYPDALPYNLRVAHGQTQLQGRLLLPYRVSVTPTVRHADGQTVPVPELTFEVRLESRLEHAYRLLATALFGVGLPYLMLGGLALAATLVWQHYQTRKGRSRERSLSTAYLRLRERIKLEQWGDARQEIERIQALRAHYRDVDQLEALVGSAETAAWRREQLYAIGSRAYAERDWPRAVQAFRSIESETPYYRDVRFLRRTAGLYADLRSRDRSMRVTAAHELGDVADLVDMEPLVDALGDPSQEVVAAARDSFGRMGVAAFDALLAASVHDQSQVREQAYSLLEELGQEARGQLIGSLKSPEPRITSRASRLLSSLGAREELAESLLWIAPPHQEAIVAALISEGAAAAGPLLDGLSKAPPERQQVYISALAALKTKADIGRRMAEALRSTRDPAAKNALQRAVDAQPGAFRVATKRETQRAPAPSDKTSAKEPQPVRRLRLLDRHR